MDLIVKQQDQTVVARFGDHTCQVAIGRGGMGQKLAEGDGVSPLGCWPIRQVYYRADRLEGAAPWGGRAIAIAPDDGWCDAPHHPQYNTMIQKPFSDSHEDMWREDNVYDVVVVLGFNDQPVQPGLGSAIFLHIARENYAPTQGCAALSKEDLLSYLSQAGPQASVCFQAAD